MTAHRNDWLSLKGYLNLQFSIFVSYLDFDAVFNVHCTLYREDNEGFFTMVSCLLLEEILIHSVLTCFSVWFKCFNIKSPRTKMLKLTTKYSDIDNNWYLKRYWWRQGGKDQGDHHPSWRGERCPGEHRGGDQVRAAGGEVHLNNLFHNQCRYK